MLIHQMEIISQKEAVDAISNALRTSGSLRSNEELEQLKIQPFAHLARVQGFPEDIYDLYREWHIQDLLNLPPRRI